MTELVLRCLIPLIAILRQGLADNSLQFRRHVPLAKMGARNVPPELQRIISKALAKNRDERYQTAKDMLIDLRNLKKRLELDFEIERSAGPDLVAPPATRGESVSGPDSIEGGRS